MHRRIIAYLLALACMLTPLMPPAAAEGGALAVAEEAAESGQESLFERGYAIVTTGGARFDGEQQLQLDKGAVVYAAGRDSHDRLKAWIDADDGAIFGWVRAEDVRPLDDEECAAFVSKVAARSDVRFFNGDKSIPLDRISVPQAADVLPASEDEAGQRENSSADATVQPTASPEPLTLPQGTLCIGVGETVQLSPDAGDGEAEFSYASSKKKNATVSQNGLVTGMRKGATIITVSTGDGREATCRVEVYAAPKKVTVSPTTLMLGVGESGEISYSLPANSVGSVRFSSDAPEIASVDEITGEVQAKAVGRASICAQAYNGKAAYAVVEVKCAPESVNIGADGLTIGVGQTAHLSASVNDGAAGRVSWSSMDESIAVCEGGSVTGLAVGQAEIIATAYNGVSGRCVVTVIPAPERIELPYDELTIGVGETVQLEPYAGEGADEFSYESSKQRYASVSADGLVTGLRKGTANIRVRTYNGQSAICKVHVLAAPKKVTLSASTLTLGVGESDRIAYKLPAGSAGQVTFASSDPAIVSVDALSGELLAQGVGTATVCAETYNGRKAWATVAVKSAPERVTLSETALTIGAGQSVGLSAEPNAGAAGQIAWNSSDPSVAVCENGVVTGVAAGEAEIVATVYNGVSAKCGVTVEPAPQKVILPETTITIGVGETLRLQPTTDAGVGEFTYRSGRTKYVRVSADGMVRGVRKGAAIVYVRAYNGVEAACKVNVCAAPKQVTLCDAFLELGVGESYMLEYRLPGNTAGAVAFASSNPEIAQVDAQTGVITAKQTGSAVITATTYNGKTAQCAVGVYPAPDSIDINAEALDLGVGQAFQLNASIPENNRSQIRYTSSDNMVATVSDSGEIIAVGCGSAVIRVQTCAPEVYAEVQVTVWSAPTEISLGAEKMAARIGETLRLSPIISTGSYSPYAFASSDPAIASVSADGTVMALQRGTVTLSVSTYNGLTAHTELRVWHPDFPDMVELRNEPPSIDLHGGEYALEYTVEPASSATMVQWRSSNENAAVIDQNGVITPVGYGFSQITAVSLQDQAVLLEFTLTVQMENLALTVPARTTSVSGIPANLAKINSIRRSVIAQINALQEGGVISAGDASKRRSIVSNVFEDYAFPWMTPTTQPYWKAANSDGGVKDFQPGVVYYGMPYTSGVAKTRQYNFEKALSEGRYVDSGSGYYLLNQDNLLKGAYVGNDCSALVNAAIWGVNDRHVYDRTSRIAVSKVYKTIKNPLNMRPGDLLCLSGRHVVMFLYYANPEKTKIMIIENGGKEWGVNTVHCSVHDLSDYLDEGYRVRRLSALD